ncbi:growth inhibitor PemK [Methylobacterium isbiliense]|uniref:growth inhibitor PemK n=1 Tax=Methylobacterium isbiliense TaxID=315478 RepID=UPI0025B5FAD1|nr:growth inhibitor PemK [Methylobacterium isbiliense]MDN3627999.1 growth inhibitor PemK [Methylobacterium isbiliense]
MKIPPRPPIGHLVAYEYLWWSQSEGQDHGFKTYPCAIVLTVEMGGQPICYALGISHSPPRSGQRALEFPPKLAAHLGLDTEPAWVYTDEFNVFAWPGPDLRPADRLPSLPGSRDTCVIGRLPTDWFDKLKEHFSESYRLRLAKPVPRRS